MLKFILYYYVSLLIFELLFKESNLDLLDRRKAGCHYLLLTKKINNKLIFTTEYIEH